MNNSILPVYGDDKNAIACSCSNEYIPYLSVYLKSLLENTNNNNSYDIVVLESDITELNKEKILKINNKSNCSIRFLNVSNLFDNLNLHIQYDYFAKQCYYRLAVGDVFNKYKKVLFTDIDLIFNFDVNEIFSINMNDFPLAACKEILWTQKNRKNQVQSQKNVEKYIKETLKTDDYYNTGVLLVDISKFRKHVQFDNLISIALKNQFINQEQDVLNMVFSNNFKTLDYSYNYEVISFNWGGIEPSYEEYTSKINNAKIYHYLTNIKVWQHPELLKGELWWKFARNTPFYEELLSKMVDFKTKNKDINNRFISNEYNLKLNYVLDHILLFKWIKLKYKIEKIFSLGDKREKYKRKYKNVKKLIKDAQLLKQQFLNFNY